MYTRIYAMKKDEIRIEKITSRKAAELIADFFGTDHVYSTSERATYAAADARGRFWIPLRAGKDVILLPPEIETAYDYMMTNQVVRFVSNSR